MTRLREQLRQARRAYDASRYPGDLAAELLPGRAAPRDRFFRPWAGGAAAAAVVALVALVIADRPGGPGAPVPVVSLAPTAPDRPRPTPLAYQLPDSMPLTLPAAPLLPATPPVNVSLTGLNDFRPSYAEFGPKLRQHLTLPGLWPAPAEPKPAGVEPRATTQQAA